MRIQHLLAGCLLLSLQFLPVPAHAAQSYDNCEGHFIDSLPATISTQGTWCLRHDLSTGISSGNAITVATNNVTIDCNDFKIGGMAAGAATQATGIGANDRLNVTIRHCNVRGFMGGIGLWGGSGHVVEDNRIEGSTGLGIHAGGDGTLIQRNSIRDTGGTPVASAVVLALDTNGDVDVLDNNISGVVPAVGSTAAFGINVDQGLVRGNRIRGLVDATGIYVFASSAASLRANDLFGNGAEYGIRCGSTSARLKDNVIAGFTSGNAGCGDAGGNDINP